MRIASSIGTASNLEEYLSLVNRQVESHGAPFGTNAYLFRGQADEAWPLAPGIERHRRVSASTENRMLEEFKRRAVPYVESSHSLSDLDWLSIAQHHGMPTRLLDWTANALCALWFAIHKPVELVETPGLRCAAVWMLLCRTDDWIRDDERGAPLQIRGTKLFEPAHISRRICAQDGFFTVRAREPSGSNSRLMPLDVDPGYCEMLGYIKVPSTSFGLVRGQLQVEGITLATLFPDLDGVARAVAATHCYPDDQMQIAGEMR
ncbi:FRG domain-containing protein [Paraburkholderia pallida]|uniref:FRG domain-containing protein n=1 Tax=Paraburkholderia pallida TaxID=2547399 RepID=A0A4P7D6F3_9BURK|nr:FRG domain-containing protein [Paraburkholderia pallida]QBR04346.1 FRG domain-containing protein [Paraburkholderia pallida]